MNKKALALVLALIISIPLTLVPMSGAFADSDIGISNSLLLSCFAWYTGTPGVDSAGIWYGSSFEEYSDSVESGVAGTTSFGVQCLLNTSGDYVDYQLNEYPFYANSWNSPILIVQLLLDRSSYGGPVEDLAYQFYTDTNDVIYEPFYQYVVPRFTLNNTDYVVMNLFFNIGVSVNSGHPHIKILYDGTPANFIAMGMRFMGYRYSPEATLTTAELYQIQTDLITSFNMARLLDAIGSDSSGIDLSTIENALASMDAKLTTIISNTDNVETLVSDLIDAVDDNTDVINLFYEYVQDLYSLPLYLNNGGTFYELNDNSLDLYTSNRFYTDHTYIFIPDIAITSNYSYYFRFYFDPYGYSYNGPCMDIYYHLYDTRIDPTIFNPDITYKPLDVDWYPYYTWPTDRDLITYGYSYLDSLSVIHSYKIYFVFKPNYPFSRSSSNVYFSYYSMEKDLDFYHRVLYYLKKLFNGNSDNNVTDDITSTAAELDQEAQSVESFESTYQTQLQVAHDDVDLTDYPINATNGMTYLQTYTNRAFVASNGFRVFIIYPIIFVLIGIFLRRFV